MQGIRRCSPEAEAILLVAVEHGADIMRNRDRGGSTISVADVRFLVPGDEPRKRALWTAALGEIEALGYAAPTTPAREVFQVTAHGRRYVAKVSQAGSESK